MTESAINLTIGSIISGITLIGVSVEEYNLKNERILELQREIQMITPFIQNLQTCSPQVGIHGRLQKLSVLLQQIKSWIHNIGQMSKFKHFFFAISHKKQINKYYLEIKEIKMELGFEMRVGNFQSQTKLNQQMDDLLESLKQNSSTEDYEKIKLLFDTQRELYDTKLQAHKEFIQEMDLKFNDLIQEHDLEIEKLKYQVQEHQYEIESLKTKIQELDSRINQVEFNSENGLLNEKLSMKYKQIKFDEEVFKNLKRNYHNLNSKFTKVKLYLIEPYIIKPKQKNIDICLELIIILNNLNTKSRYLWLQGLQDFMEKQKTLQGIILDTSQISYVLTNKQFNMYIIPPMIKQLVDICNDIRNQIDNIYEFPIDMLPMIKQLEDNYNNIRNLINESMNDELIFP